MGMLFLLTVLVTVSYASEYLQTHRTCIGILCVINSTCHEVLNRTSGVISPVCLNSDLYPPNGNEQRCSNGRPLWVISSTGGYSEAACGRVVDRTTCPRDYTCVIAPIDAYSLCCPGSYPSKNLVKSGRCPAPASDNVGICVDTCQSDSDCDHDLKCCRNPCGAFTCQKPAKSRVLTCHDVHCQKDMVCIETPTGPKCMPIAREGECPAPRFIQDCPKCSKRCRRDGDCPGVQKCCRGGSHCGMTCVDPVPSRTCKNTRCPHGQKCILKEVECIRAPCFPVPTCV